jgi:hypothetical protein
LVRNPPRDAHDRIPRNEATLESWRVQLHQSTEHMKAVASALFSQGLRSLDTSIYTVSMSVGNQLNYGIHSAKQHFAAAKMPVYTTAPLLAPQPLPPAPPRWVPPPLNYGVPQQQGPYPGMPPQQPGAYPGAPGAPPYGAYATQPQPGVPAGYPGVPAPAPPGFGAPPPGMAGSFASPPPHAAAPPVAPAFGAAPEAQPPANAFGAPPTTPPPQAAALPYGYDPAAAASPQAPVVAAAVPPPAAVAPATPSPATPSPAAPVPAPVA